MRKFHLLARSLGHAFGVWVARLDERPVAAAIVLLGANAHYTRGAMDVELAGPGTCQLPHPFPRDPGSVRGGLSKLPLWGDGRIVDARVLQDSIRRRAVLVRRVSLRASAADLDRPTPARRRETHDRNGRPRVNHIGDEPQGCPFGARNLTMGLDFLVYVAQVASNGTRWRHAPPGFRESGRVCAVSRKPPSESVRHRAKGASVWGELFGWARAVDRSRCGVRGHRSNVRGGAWRPERGPRLARRGRHRQDGATGLRR